MFGFEGVFNITLTFHFFWFNASGYMYNLPRTLSVSAASVTLTQHAPLGMVTTGLYPLLITLYCNVPSTVSHTSASRQRSQLNASVHSTTQINNSKHETKIITPYQLIKAHNKVNILISAIHGTSSSQSIIALVQMKAL